MNTKYVLSLDDAKKIAGAAAETARANGWRVVIAIVDDGGGLQYLERADGVQPASIDIAQQKARAAALFRRPTKALEDIVASGRIAMLSLPNITPVEGGVPLVYRGEIVGAIGVSGVQSFEDGQIAKAGADYLLAQP